MRKQWRMLLSKRESPASTLHKKVCATAENLVVAFLLTILLKCSMINHTNHTIWGRENEYEQWEIRMDS